MLSNLQPKPPSSDPDFDLVEDILEKRKQSDKHLADWRTDAKNWYGMVSGGEDQWRSEDKAILDDQGKPCVSFNRVAVMVKAICGYEANNRQEVQYLPRTMDDAGVNDLLTDAAKWARDQCDAEDEESDSFRDMVICGYGWTETKMDYESNPEGMVEVSRRDPGNFRYDPKAIKRNLADAKWVQCDDFLDEDAILARWPEATLEGTEDVKDSTGEPHDATQAPFYLKSAVEEVPEDGRTVIHHCWIETAVVWMVQSPPPLDMMTGQPLVDPQTGQPMQPQMQEMSDEEYKLAQTRSTALSKPLSGRRTTKRVYKHAYILGKQLLETGEAPCQYEFIYKCMTGYRDRNSGTFYGIVKDIEDPQRFANKLVSQLLHMINTNAKGGVMVEEGAVPDIRKFEENWAKTDSVLVVNAGALTGAKIQPKPMPLYPQAITDMLTFAVSSIRDGSGVNLEMLGLADRMQAGVVEEQRTSAGMTIVATLFDSLRQYRKQQGRLLAHFIIQYMSDGRLIRVSGPIAQSYVPLLRQRGVMDYDVIVDDAPTARDMKAKTFEALMQIAPMVMQAGGPVPEEALDYAPIPSQLAQSWKKQIAEKKQNQQADPQVQMAQAVAQAEQAKVQVAQVKGQADVQAAQVGLQMKGLDLELRKQESAMKAQEHQATMQLSAFKLQEMQAARADDSDNQTKILLAKMDENMKAYVAQLQEETKRMIAAGQIALQLSQNVPQPGVVQ
jgi:hypothetical protein